MIEDRGIDSKRFVVVTVATVQEFEHNQLKSLTSTRTTEKDRKPIMFVLDSLGMLSYKRNGRYCRSKETRDMRLKL